MSNTIRIKRSTGSSAPTTLENAELAFAEGNEVLYIGIGSGGSGGSGGGQSRGAGEGPRGRAPAHALRGADRGPFSQSVGRRRGGARPAPLLLPRRAAVAARSGGGFVGERRRSDTVHMRLLQLAAVL